MDSPVHWLEFNLFVLFAVVLDLAVFHRRPHEIRVREAFAWSAAWITLALAFGALILHFYGRQPALEYYTGYLIEKALSVDNLFVFLVIFHAFSVEPKYQQRVLGWGILGALIMRGAMIAAGVALIERFNWVLYVFGAFLLFVGGHMLLAIKAEAHPEKNFLVRYASKHLRVTREFQGEKFFAREEGRLSATPLLLVLLVVEIMDVTFALDSIPAIFGITRDPFIVYTSNVFAILGLRALYFLLAGVLGRFTYLKTGLALVLMFVGTKMLVEPWIHVPVAVSLGIVLALLAVTIAASLLPKPKVGKAPGPSAKESFTPLLERLSSGESSTREAAAAEIFRIGRIPADRAVQAWRSDAEFARLLGDPPLVTVGVAVQPGTFARIREAHGMPGLAEVPPDQDAGEFELTFPGTISLDILTTKAPGTNGAIARFLQKFGEGVQQVEFLCRDVDRATVILNQRFGVAPVYPATRPGANGTRVNFFLVASSKTEKILIELYEPPIRGH